VNIKMQWVGAVSAIWRCAWLLFVAMAAMVQARAQGLDGASRERERRAAVEPICAAVLVQVNGLSTDQKYQKALCQLYGVDTPPQRDLALDTLRDLASKGYSAAQLALADHLRSGTNAEMREAMQWNDRAAGFSQPIYAPDPFGNGDDPAARMPGYHCHMFWRRQVCHGGPDY